MIIALTHMRAPNDQRLAEMAPDIDIILGGHDHDYYGLQVIGLSLKGRGTPHSAHRGSLSLLHHFLSLWVVVVVGGWLVKMWQCP